MTTPVADIPAASVVSSTQGFKSERQSSQVSSSDDDKTTETKTLIGQGVF